MKGAPAVWPVGVPIFPSAVPPCAVSPGRMTCRPENGPGCTTNDALVLVCGGEEKSEQVSATAPPAPKKVTWPDQAPAANVIRLGVTLPAPVFAWRFASPT